MRAAISLLVLLLSMCGVQTESHGTDASTQDVSTGLKELRDMVVELRGSLRHTQHEADNYNVAMKQRLAVSESKVEVLEADNVAVKERLANSESKVEALERALQDTKAEMKTEVDNLKLRLFVTETEVENLEKEIRAAPKVAFSAGLVLGYTHAENNERNLVFKRVFTNVGEAYSSTTGFFTAPVRGVYYFRFTVMDWLSGSMAIEMNKNGQSLINLYDYDTDGRPSYLSSGLTLQLEKEDTVNMGLPRNSRLNDYFHSCTFSGFLLFPL